MDLQLRTLNYEFNGNDINGELDRQEVNLEFFNPKFGLSHYLNKNQLFYASYAVANKEPNRADYVESSPNSRPVHETLFDTEIGYKYQDKWLIFNLNFYYMDYDNQLIKTGEINDVGYFTSKNVKKYSCLLIQMKVRRLVICPESLQNNFLNNIPIEIPISTFRISPILFFVKKSNA